MTGGGGPPLPSMPGRAPSASVAALERQAHTLINQHRVRQGLAPLEYHEALADLAREHSEAMASGRRAFSHVGFDARSDAAGALLTLRGFAENIASNSGMPNPEVTAVEGWIGSPDHRRNLEGLYQLTGIGVGISPDGSYYFTQVFVATGEFTGPPRSTSPGGPGW
jgi:uncharacterized protein YkwD